MTTIAYKDGVVAWDSLSCAGELITNIERDVKHFEHDGAEFWCAGAPSEFDALREAHCLGNLARFDLDISTYAITWDGEKLYITCVSEGVVVFDPISPCESIAIGSGSKYAIGAMDCGKTAQEAVQIAARRDTGTGGTIRRKRLFREHK